MTTSSITFNVGAPTFGVRFTLSSEGRLCRRFCAVSHPNAFPFWNDASGDRSMNLITNPLYKPSSNTLNVGAPTFPVAHPFRGEAFHSEGNIAPYHPTPSGLKGLSYNPVSK